MTKRVTTGADATASRPTRDRSFRLVYDHAVRDTLTGGRRKEILELLEGTKRLQAEYGDFDTLVSALEHAAKQTY